MRFNTALLHGDFASDPKTGATLTPIYQSAAFEHGTAEELEELFAGRRPGFTYTRVGNPTVEAFERRMTRLEGGIGAAACSSGMAAISMALLNILRGGDEIVSGSGIFGGTIGLFEDLRGFGIGARLLPDHRPESFEKAIGEKTRLIFVETIGNPKLDVTDIAGLAEIAHTKNIPLVVDNTVTTPYLCRPIELGADLVVHSTSKFISGNGSSIGGILVDAGRFRWDAERFPGFAPFLRFGRFAFLAKLRSTLYRNLGACLSPLNAYMNGLGLETLGLRMERLCANAFRLARCLSQHPGIRQVNYPGLAGGEDYRTAKKQFGDRYGAILTVRAGSKERAFRLINALKYAKNLSNIGDSRTLVIHPASTIYLAADPRTREDAGVFDDLIRISVGLEDVEDLCDDFCQAADRM